MRMDMAVWIDPKDKLPKSGERSLFVIHKDAISMYKRKDHVITIGAYQEKEKMFQVFECSLDIDDYDLKDIIAWMPLPEYKHDVD